MYVHGYFFPFHLYAVLGSRACATLLSLVLCEFRASDMLGKQWSSLALPPPHAPRLPCVVLTFHLLSAFWEKDFKKGLYLAGLVLHILRFPAVWLLAATVSAGRVAKRNGLWKQPSGSEAGLLTCGDNPGHVIESAWTSSILYFYFH